MTGPPRPLRSAWKARRIALPISPGVSITSVCFEIGAYARAGEKLGLMFQAASPVPPGRSRYRHVVAERLRDAAHRVLGPGGAPG